MTSPEQSCWSKATGSDWTPLRDALAALERRFGELRLEAMVQAKQRNHTWTMHTADLAAVVKQYRWLSPSQTAEVTIAERIVRAGGVPAPELLWHVPGTSVVVHRLAPGRHVAPQSSDQIRSTASLFARQLTLLRAVNPTWTTPRPNRLPRRAQHAVEIANDALLAEMIVDGWAELGIAAADTATTPSHTDWRADNLLFEGQHVSAVLDWEDVVMLPAQEAIGLAAASVTHSWRRDLYQPLTLSAVAVFLEEVERLGDWLSTPARRVHARMGCRYAAAVRLVEDRARGVADVSLADVREAFT